MDIQNLFQKVLNSSHDGILILDNKGNIIFSNEALSRIVNCESSKLIGENINTLIQKHIISKRSPSLKALREKRKVTQLFEIRGQKILITATPCLDDHNSVEYIITNIRNLSELDLNISNEIDSPIIVSKHQIIKKEVIREKIQALGFPDFNFESNEMTEICDLALRVAPLDIPILIIGETGVGKGLLAQIIHKSSSRKNLPMLEINCSGFPESLIDSELFGYRPGTFTGARKMGKTGLIEAANNSTLFLDEIGTMPLDFQVKLLKFLDDGYILPLGSTERKWVNVRIIASTNNDLYYKLEKGEFRKDLYYRLSVMPIVIPPLRKRREDIKVLIESFLKKYQKKYQKSVNISEEIMQRLLNYDYPGNVRELKNIVERLVLLSKNEILEEENLKQYLIFSNSSKNETFDMFFNDIPLKERLGNYEKEVIKKLMEKYKSTYKVAKILGVSQPTISRKLSRYNLH